MNEEKAQSYKIIKSKDDLRLVKEFLSKNVYIAFDIETTGLNVRKDDIIGIGISNKEFGFYLVHKHFNIADQDFDFYLDHEAMREILNVIESKNQLITHNGSFDLRFTKNFFGVDLVENLWSENMLAKHTVDEERPFGLKDIAAKIYGEDAKEEQKLMKQSIKDNGGSTNEFFKADLDLMAQYCVQDCMLTFKLNAHYLEKIKSEGLSNFYFNEEVMPLYKNVTIPMEDKGLPVDVPKMELAQKEITEDIINLEKTILNSIQPHLGLFEDWFLNKDYPVSRTSANPFTQALAKLLNIECPKTKTGSYSFTAKNLANLEAGIFKDFMLNGINLDKELIRKVQLEMHGNAPMFNISSKFHLKKLFFDTLKEDALSHTKLGSPQIDEDFLELLKPKYDFVAKIIEYNKLIKLKGTYIDRFLEAQEDGIFYPRFMQHNTISGRYGSDLQQLSRAINSGPETVIKYTNQIRTFFIAGKDHVVIDADYESLEPHVFAHVSNDEGLKNIFLKGHDFYSTISIMTEGLTQFSADKSAENYLGKLAKDKRQTAKAYALGIPYGMTDYKLQFEIGVSQKEAAKLIENYLKAFPSLASWMSESKQFACKKGFIQSQAGRVRHMSKLVSIWSAYGEDILDSLDLWKKYNDNPRKYEQMKYLRKEANNFINNARNFQIQSLAASITNRACIAVSKYMKENNIGGYVCAQIHDQIVLRVPAKHATLMKEKLQYFMENTYKISLPLKAPAQIGTNFADAH